MKFLQALDDEGGWRGKCIALRQIEQQLAAHARLASKDARELVKFMVRKRLLNNKKLVYSGSNGLSTDIRIIPLSFQLGELDTYEDTSCTEKY